MMQKKKQHRRDVTGHSDQPVKDDVPFTMKLPDDRTVFVLVPAKWCRRDVSGEIAFKMEAVRLLDRVQVLAMSVPATPTGGFIRTLRQAMNLTQAQMAERLGVDRMTVYRWERGAVKPSNDAIKALNNLRKAAARKGITIAA